MGYRQARWDEPLIFELGAKGRRGFIVPDVEAEVLEYTGKIEVPETLRRKRPPLIPELSEVEVARHFIRLSQMSYGVDSGPTPLGSCTMKYNPKAFIKYISDPRVTDLHPLQDEDTVQGVLEAMYELQRWLASILGMDVCTLHPAAGAQGELAGVIVIRRYHDLRGTLKLKDEIIVPDSAHGTNPASASMGGFKVVEVPTAEDGNIDLDALEAALSERTAGLMITNPSTLGLFEERITEIARLVHAVDGLLYYDGANLNGIMGYSRPGDMGFDIAHVNIHKTFSAPHGGGGPGAGPVCVKDREVASGVRLGDLLPGPIVVKRRGAYRLEMPRHAPGKLKSFFANTLVLLWGYAYILALGAKGLREVTELAVLNTNYFLKLVERLTGYSLPYARGRPRKHEAVLSAEPLKRETGVTAEDVAKGLLDRGFYAPTIYFPLIVREALMVELTDSETRESIEAYARALAEIEEEARRDPSKAKSRPLNTSVGRVDNVKANHPRTVAPTWRVLRLKREGVLGPLR